MFCRRKKYLDFQNASYFSRKNDLCVNILLTFIFVLQRMNIFFYLLYYFIYLYIFNNIIVNFFIKLNNISMIFKI